MRATLTALVPLVLLATNVGAAPVNITEQGGSPAIESSGSSSTTVSVVGGTASVTLEGSGSAAVYTHSGTISGEGTAGVPQLGVEVGGGLNNGTNGGETLENGTSDGGPGDAGSGAGTGDSLNSGNAGVDLDDVLTGSGGANGTNSGNGTSAGTRTAELTDTCDATSPRRDATMVSLALVSDAARVSIIVVCGDQSILPSRLIGAIEKNSVLVSALDGAGYGPASVVGAETPENGSAVLYVAGR